MDLADLEHNMQIFWTLMASALVLFMQAGFCCCLEAGSVRTKNSINVALKNIIDLCASIAAYFVIGYALMFGLSKSGIIGQPSFFLLGEDDFTSFFFQATFCGTAATIVSGGIAERCRFLPYLIISVALSVLIYPIFGHWVWGGGWLSELGYKDFAGSSVVHMVGAGVALAGIQVLGARQGRFLDDGQSRSLPASSMPLVAIGVIILTFGWIGFNGGSAALGKHTPGIIANTVLAACFGGLAALLTSWAYGGLARVDLVLNGVLGGLVAITACADCVSIQASAVIGIIGGVVVVISTKLLESWKIDDAVGAVPVHGFAGMAGIIATAIFIDDQAFAAINDDRIANGQTTMTSLHFLGVQLLGGVVCAAWAYITGLLLWWLIGKITQLRIGRFEEAVGLNYSEHKVANPVEELTLAVQYAAQGRHDEMRERMDAAGGDLSGLTESIRSLAEATAKHQQKPDAFMKALKNVNAQLLSKQRKGQDLALACEEAVSEVNGKINNVISFVKDRLDDQHSISLLQDLSESIQEKLKSIKEKFPAQQNLWHDVSEASNTLDRVLLSLRGEQA